MKPSRYLLCTISLSLAATAGCGEDDTQTSTSSGTNSTSSSSSGSSSGEGGMGTGGGGEGGMGTGGMGTGGMGTGGMGTGGMSSSSSSSSSSGSGGSGAVCNPEGPFNGAAIAAPANTWTWVDVPGAKCRDGSATGIGVRINPNSTKLVIYLEGGGACFNGLTCQGNPKSYNSGNFGTGPKGGIFDTTNAANSVKDWSFVYVPYCTGDVHGGNATNVDVPGALGPKGQQFVGYTNIGEYLKRVIPTFKDATEVLLTGVSAGGFGAFYNYDRVAQAFCPTPVALIDDSGPPMSDAVMVPCLQQRWRTLYGFNSTLPKDCVDCALPNGGGLANTWKLLGEKYSDRNLGLISSDKDNTIAQFYGFGKNNCANIDAFASALSGAEYAAGLNEVRETFLKPTAAWSTFFVNSTSHTYLGGGSYYSTTVMGTALTTWTAGIVDGAAATHVGP